ncbi:MAG TPA: UDP-3-O-(3-hydroxymyristoyl)glucosamine N-acyltransferase [Elusimicrobia bacterium]|jgi:UDP-3-O-[3-hydroxymyristoyl] glucosamine N-acyltransferase|nr:UDP-3-O-(3-hydroxymyristoyl)glucosamine N-acyltransferase [Elusimicrobiota bacterium]
MELKLKEIAKLVQGKIEGNENILIKGVSGLSEARKEEISFLSDIKYLPQLKKTKAGAVIVSENIVLPEKNLIKVKNPYLAFVKVLNLVNEESALVIHPQGIHPTALIGKNVKLDKEVTLGAYTVIEDNTEIGKGTIVYPLCYIGKETKIGKNCLIYSRVCIREKTDIGDNVIIHSGTVIGSDGFGFLSVEGKQEKIPQIGRVEIGNSVEIGANCTIDRATVGKTKIGSGTKIDNLVQIGHNVEIGENCVLAGQVGIAGSTKIGNNVFFGGQAGVADHISIGQGVKVAAQAGVIGNIADGLIVSGYPAREHRKMLRIQALIDRLPELYQYFRKLRKRPTSSKDLGRKKEK